MQTDHINMSIKEIYKPLSIYSIEIIRINWGKSNIIIYISYIIQIIDARTWTKKEFFMWDQESRVERKELGMVPPSCLVEMLPRGPLSKRYSR